MRPIEEIAAAAGINAEALDFHGRYKAKIDPAKLAGPPAGGASRARQGGAGLGDVPHSRR